MTNATRHTFIDASQFKAGMVLSFYGATYRLRDDVKAHHWANSCTRHDYNLERPVFTATGDRIDAGTADMPATWNFQGNSRSTWVLEESEAA